MGADVAAAVLGWARFCHQPSQSQASSPHASHPKRGSPCGIGKPVPIMRGIVGVLAGPSDASLKRLTTAEIGPARQLRLSEDIESILASTSSRSLHKAVYSAPEMPSTGCSGPSAALAAAPVITWIACWYILTATEISSSSRARSPSPLVRLSSSTRWRAASSSSRLRMMNLAMPHQRRSSDAVPTFLPARRHSLGG